MYNYKRIHYWVLYIVLFANLNKLNAETVLDGFENGLSSYNLIGNNSNIHLDSSINYQGKYSVRIGGSDLKLQRKMIVEPFAIMLFNTFAKTNNKIDARNVFISLQYYDKNEKLINEFKCYVQDSIWKKYEITMITPPLASYAIISYNYNNDSLNTFVNFDESYWSTNSIIIPNINNYNYEKYLTPFWSCDTVFDESILLYSEKQNNPKATLLYSPLEMLNVSNYYQKKYLINVDFHLNKKDVICSNMNEMPFFYDTLFAKDVYWYNLLYNNNQYYPQWVNVTYRNKRDWNGPKIESKIKYLNNTYTKLLAKEKLKIAIIGNSIARGMYVSGLLNFKPYMESYFTMFCKYLEKYYNNSNIETYDLSMPAALAKKYGLECFNDYIKPVNPDLLLIDFGMADFWGTSPDEFRNAIVQIIDSVKQNNSKAEIIVVSEMKFDPGYLQDTSQIYIRSCYAFLKGYQVELQKMEKNGIANVDVYSISDSLQIWKKPKDLLTDPVHPNDYMARWYAQSLISALVPVMSGSINKIVNRSNQFVLDNMESKVAQSFVGTNEIIISNKQDWEFHKLANGNNRILSNDSKLALAIENGELIQTIIKDSTSQEWEIIPLDNQFFKLKNIATQMYLGIDTISNKIEFQNENSSLSQEWNIFYSYKKEELAINRDTTIIEYTSDSSKFLQIESNTKWTVSTSANWLHLDKNDGNGNKSLKIVIDENLDKIQRTTVIDISTNGLKKQHFVLQSGSKTSIKDTTISKNNIKIISPTENDNNVYMICEDCSSTNIYVELFDVVGRVIFQKEYTLANQMIKIETNQFSSSQYLIKVNNGNQTIIEKVIINK